MRQVVAYKKIINRQAQKVVAVAYEKWSHMVVRLYSGLVQIKIDGRTPFSWAQTAHEIS